MESFAARLRRLIRESGEPSKVLAARAAISAQYLSDLAAGRRDAVSFDVAERLAAALRCEPSDLDAPVRIILPYSEAQRLIAAMSAEV
jgi:DNA-binding Xre family transcriptional regulator